MPSRCSTRGKARVAEKKDGKWVVNQWLKKAVLLSFRIEDNAVMEGGFTNYYDKVPSKFADTSPRTSARRAYASCHRRSRAAAPTSHTTWY